MEKVKIEVIGTDTVRNEDIVKVANKEVRVPRKIIEQNQVILGITRHEALTMFLEDEGYLENEEVEALTKKAKDSGIMKTIHEAGGEGKKTKRNRPPTQNPDKEMLIELIAEALRVPASITNVKVTNKTKYITFRLNDKDFEVNLVEKRKKKE